MISYKSLPGLKGKTNKPGLYQNIYAAPLRAFATIAKPVDVTASDAQMVTIAADHTFAIGEGFIKLYSTKDTAQLTSELIGELDGFNMNPKIEFFHPGTDGDALAFANRAPYDEWIFMVKTIEGKYLQLGEADMGANVRQANAATGTLSSGRKGTAYLADSFNSYFIYEGTIQVKGVEVPVVEVPVYDFYVASDGDDSGDGITPETAWASITRLQQEYLTIVEGTIMTVGVLEGTYTGQIKSAGMENFVAETVLEIHCHGKVIFDSSAGDNANISFLDAAGSSVNKIYLYGETDPAKRTEIVGQRDAGTYANNGLGSAGSGQLYAYNLDVHGWQDGISSHFTSHIYAEDVRAYRCSKSGYAMVNNSTYEFVDCKFEDWGSMILGAAYSEPLTSGVLNNCDIWAIEGVNAAKFNLTNATLNSCRIGKMVQGAYDYSIVDGAIFNNCFINIPIQHYLNTQFTGCFGLLTIRPRGPITDTLSISHCTFKPHSNSDFVLFNYYADPNDIGGSVTIRDSIIVDGVFNYSGNATMLGYINDNWTLEYINHFGSNIGGVTIANAQNTDPLLINPTSEIAEDWYVASNSPCVGAASDAGTIGLGVAN